MQIAIRLVLVALSGGLAEHALAQQSEDVVRQYCDLDSHGIQFEGGGWGKLARLFTYKGQLISAPAVIGFLTCILLVGSRLQGTQVLTKTTRRFQFTIRILAT